MVLIMVLIKVFVDG